MTGRDKEAFQRDLWLDAGERPSWLAEDDPRAPWIEGGKRCALYATGGIEGWWVGISPRNGEGASVEGPWEHWVTLARGILEADEKYRAQHGAAEDTP